MGDAPWRQRKWPLGDRRRLLRVRTGSQGTTEPTWRRRRRAEDNTAPGAEGATTEWGRRRRIRLRRVGGDAERQLGAEHAKQVGQQLPYLGFEFTGFVMKSNKHYCKCKIF